ncbi:rhamnogalacturonan acetylesterase [Bacillus sp. NPDC077027]|uniref:rhamnogalacturonan acetylesterase n=1 Tax=Bacillus sp. NPDC077027 TaxID=3390548 RepID=UPI003D037230
MKKVLLFFMLIGAFFTFMGGDKLEAVKQQEVMKFDFGSRDVETGYKGVKAEDQYTKEKGYGFYSPKQMENVSASGTGVKKDAVQFLSYGMKSTNTFQVDLANGWYEVEVILGDTARASVAAEGYFQVMNMTGNGASATFRLPITDGQLNLLVTEGKEGTAFTLSALHIQKLSDDATGDQTLFIGGDSTVCQYYPLDSSVQAGWGQMIEPFLQKGAFYVKNLATGGQFARGFYQDGQFASVLYAMKPGDIFLVQFGINDTNPKNNESEAEYKEWMREMIRQVRQKGGEVILSTPQGRATDFNEHGVHSSTDRWYRMSTLALAKEEQVRLVDLNVLSSAYFTSIGREATSQLYMEGDSLHPNRKGAKELARIITTELKAQGVKGF